MSTAMRRMSGTVSKTGGSTGRSSQPASRARCSTVATSAVSPVSTSARLTSSSGWWLMPSGLRRNSMPTPVTAPSRHGVVPRAAEQRGDVPATGVLDPGAHDVLQEGVAHDGGRLVQLARGPGQPAPAGDLVELPGDAAPDAVAVVVVLAAQVDRQACLAGHHVDRTRERLQAADRADDVVLGAAEPLDGERDLAGAEQGVVPLLVPGTPGVPGLAVDLHREPSRARDRGDDAQRGAAVVELRALLDVRLQVARQGRRRPRGRADPPRVQAELAERRAQRGAVLVGQVPPGLVPATGHRGRPEQRGAEPGALLVPERDDVEPEAERTDLGAQRADHLDRHEHAEDPVVPAGVAHGVQVRAEQQRRRLRVPPGQVPALVARRVLPRVQPDLAHPAGGHAVHAGVLGGEVDALDAVGHRGVRRELVAARHDAPGSGVDVEHQAADQAE